MHLAIDISFHRRDINEARTILIQPWRALPSPRNEKGAVCSTAPSVDDCMLSVRCCRKDMPGRERRQTPSKL